MSSALLVSPKEVKAQSQIGGNVDAEKLKIPIRTTQDLKIRPLLGGALYNKIESLFITGGGEIITEPYATLFNNYIKIPLILYTAAKYTLQQPLEVTNGGATTYSPNNGSSAARAEIVAQAKYIEADAETYAENMLKYIIANAESFPEYSERIDGDIERVDDPYFCGIELGDSREDNIIYLDQTGNWI